MGSIIPVQATQPGTLYFLFFSESQCAGLELLFSVKKNRLDPVFEQHHQTLKGL